MWLLCWYTAEDRATEASFRAAELHSLAAMCGVDPSRIHIATLGSSCGAGLEAEAVQFQPPIADVATVPSWVMETLEGRSVDPTMVPVYFDTDLPTAVRIAQRSVLLRALLEVWGSGLGLARCVDSTRHASGDGTPSCCKEVATQSFRVSVAGIGCHLTRDQQREAIDALLPVSGMRGPVRMKGAECVLWYVADRWEAQALAHRRRQGKVACVESSNAGVMAGVSDSASSGGLSDSAGAATKDQVRVVNDFVIFGREVASGSRHLLDRLALSERRYLGPTTMAPSTGNTSLPIPPAVASQHLRAMVLKRCTDYCVRACVCCLRGRPYCMDTFAALLSANLAAVGPGHLVLDPCCGSGSMILAAAAIGGAMAIGSDANMSVLCGEVNRKRNKGHTPSSNFQQHGLTGLCGGWAAADLTRSPFRRAHQGFAGSGVFDAIICDPPYGLREAERYAIKSPVTQGSAEALEQTEPQDDLATSAALDQPNIFAALLELAGTVLVDHGRLVYWRPVVSSPLSLSPVSAGTGVGPELAQQAARHVEEDAMAAVAARCGLVEIFRGEVRLSRRVRGHGKRGKGRGKAPAEQGGTDYGVDRDAGRERRNCIVMEKRTTTIDVEASSQV